MRILLLCYEYPPIGGGGGVGARQYAEGWAAAGHRVTVVTGRGGVGSLPARERHDGLTVVRVRTPGKKERATSTPLSMLSYLAAGLVHLLLHRREYRDVEVVNTHFALPTGPLGYAAARLLSVPQLLTIIGGDIYDPSKRSSPHRHALLRAVNRFLLRKAEAVVAISSDTKKRALEHYGVERFIRVVNYGFDAPTEAEVEKVVPPGREGVPEPYRLIAIGRLVPRKGFDHLIRAVGMLPERIELLLIGDGPLESSLRDLARELGVHDRVHFLGYQPRQRIYGYLRTADCFVLSSLHEGLGIVVQEAMWAGLPIVATDNGGQVDLVEHGRNGLLVPVADAAALAKAVRTLHDSPDAAAEMARANEHDIRSHLIEANARRYVELFAGLMDGEPGEERAVMNGGRTSS